MFSCYLALRLSDSDILIISCSHAIVISYCDAAVRLRIISQKRVLAIEIQASLNRRRARDAREKTRIMLSCSSACVLLSPRALVLSCPHGFMLSCSAVVMPSRYRAPARSYREAW